MSTIGVVLPLADDPWTDVGGRLDLIAELGFDGVWARDVPLAVSGTGDIGSGFDPIALLALAIGRGLPFREFGTAVLCPGYRRLPTLARAVASLQTLSGGRMVVGLGSGMRPPVNRAFGLDDEQRRLTTTTALRELPGLLSGQDTGLPADVTFYAPPAVPVPLLLASADPGLFAAAGTAVTGWMSPLRSSTAIRETSAALAAATGRRLGCTMQMTVEPDLTDPGRVPGLVPTATIPKLVVGTQLLGAVFGSYLAAGVDRILIHLPEDDRRWSRLRAIAAAWRSVRAEADVTLEVAA